MYGKALSASGIVSHHYLNDLNSILTVDASKPCRSWVEKGMDNPTDENDFTHGVLSIFTGSSNPPMSVCIEEVVSGHNPVPCPLFLVP